MVPISDVSVTALELGGLASGRPAGQPVGPYLLREVITPEGETGGIALLTSSLHQFFLVARQQWGQVHIFDNCST
jgi:hypothetical protein